MSNQTSTAAATEAVKRGYQPIPIRSGEKNPHISAWTHVAWSDLEEVKSKFGAWAEEGVTNVGLLLGKKSDGLIDVDLDHPRSMRLRDYFLPPTPMRHGRPGRPMSHYWYRVEDLSDIPATVRYKMPDGKMCVELRSTGSQTVIPPSVHPSGENYRWEGPKWGGAKGPLPVSGRQLRVQVALLALGCVLIDNWPQRGGRHEAYLALAGGLLRFGKEGIHPFWEKNLPVLIGALASATNDEDGPEARVKEVLGTTLAKLSAGDKAIGWTRLSETIGARHAELARRYAGDVVSAAGFSADTATLTDTDVLAEAERAKEIVSDLPPEERDPLGERLGSWQAVDLGPYLAGEVRVPQPTVLRRSDGAGLFYEGRVNSLYGRSEAAKSWVALVACQQEMALGSRVMYLDFEDEPTFTLMRLKYLGAGDDDVYNLFTYLRPEDPLMDMQRNRWGSAEPTDIGRRNHELFQAELSKVDPTLIIVDGMTVLYGLHGLDSNDAVSTDIITTWLKRLCRNGRSTVIVIDHTGKGAGKGSSPIGAHHKIAMVQGAALQAHPIKQPMPDAVGEVQLLVYKDRPGEVRKVSSKATPAVAAVITLDSTVKEVTTVSIEPPNSDDVVIGDVLNDEEVLRKAAERAEREREKVQRVSLRSATVEAVWQVFRDEGPEEFHSRIPLMDKIKQRAPEGADVGPKTIRSILTGLVSDGRMEQIGETKYRKYRVVDPS